MVLVPIVLLNLLIALMSDSYQRIQDRSIIELRFLRARILLEIELYLSPKELANPDWFPRYLHVLVPRGMNKPVGSGTKSHGISSESKAKADQRTDAVDGKVDAVTAKLEAVDAKLDSLMRSMETFLGAHPPPQ